MKAVVLNLNGYDYSHFKKGDSYHKKIKVGDILDVDKIEHECIYLFVPLVEGGHISYPFIKGKATIVNI